MLGGRTHIFTGADGREWRFEMHPYMGPILLRKDDEPAARQPGSRSPFWAAFEAWQQRRQ